MPIRLYISVDYFLFHNEEGRKKNLARKCHETNILNKAFLKE